MPEPARNAWSAPIVVSAYARGSRPEPGQESRLPDEQVEAMLAELRERLDRKAAARRVIGR